MCDVESFFVEGKPSPRFRLVEITRQLLHARENAKGNVVIGGLQV